MDDPTLKLKTLLSTLKYAFLDEEKAKLVIISSKLDMKQEEQLLEVLRKNKEAIGWTLTDLKKLDPSLCTHRIFLEDESRPAREAQRRLNPRVWEAVKEEILKWLNTKIIYPISDSQWVSPVHVVLKKAKVTVTTNEKGEEIQTRLPTKWRVCIDYRKLNSATKKDHFPLPFINQILDRLAGSNYFCFSTDIRATIRLLSTPMIKRRRRSHVLLAPSLSNACHSDCATPRDLPTMHDGNLF